MKIPKIKLHNQIVIALILGVIFGALFSVNQKKVEIISAAGSEDVENWSEFKFLKGDSVLSVINTSEQIIVSKKFKVLSKNINSGQISAEVVFPDGSKKRFDGITYIDKVKSLGLMFKPIGDIFIRLLNMIAVPLVIASLLVGAASLTDLKHVAKVGGKIMTYYMLTTAITITVGLVLANVIQPGEYMPAETRDRLLSTFQDDASSKIEQNVSIDIISFLVNIVPKNPFNAIANGDFLSIVFYAIITGVFLTTIPKEKSKTIINFFEGLSEAMINMVEKVMLLAPIAVFTLIAATVAEFGFNILQSLITYALTVLLGLFLITAFLYPALLKIFTKMKVRDFFKAHRQTMAVAFSTSSSAATLPVNLDVCEKKLGVSNKIASFVLPLGATINMDGTALYQSVAAVFIAQVYGFDLNITQQLTIILTALLASIGTAPVPGVGLIMLIVVLKSVGIPEEGIALIIGVDRLLDMCRTIPNVISDATGTVIIAQSEGELKKVKIED